MLAAVVAVPDPPPDEEDLAVADGGNVELLAIHGRYGDGVGPRGRVPLVGHHHLLARGLEDAQGVVVAAAGAGPRPPALVGLRDALGHELLGDDDGRALGVRHAGRQIDVVLRTVLVGQYAGSNLQGVVSCGPMTSRTRHSTV